MSTIKTAGQLREFLLTAMEEAKSGQLDLQRAHHIAKLAGRINESLLAEVRLVESARASGGYASSIGRTEIGDVER